ncbi:MAG: hypothetical protein EOP11_03750 [Proteobacteria bacterium]|nr:MAG: hypothetical protein EOP11_03750 [Pseudomonadota bacterium]
MQPNQWLPLTEYALRSGMSISTLRRKIKSNTIDFKMEEGRYLIRSDELTENAQGGYHSSDYTEEDEGDDQLEDSVMDTFSAARSGPPKNTSGITGNNFGVPSEIMQLRQEMQRIREDASTTQEQDSLKLRALDARVSGLAKKLDLFAEQFAELKMLVKLFEEKLDRRA